MTSIPDEAITAASYAIARTVPPLARNWDSCGEQDIARHARAIATAALEAAEQAWPHEPPKRDPASTTAAVTSLATPAAGRASIRTRPAIPFGFAPAYPGGASVDEGYRDEKWRDAQS